PVGSWRRWASSRCSREKRPQRSPQNASRCGRFWKVPRLRLMRSRSEWKNTHRDLNHVLLSCPRNWKQGWTRFELRSCWARVCDSVFSNPDCRTPPERLASLVLKMNSIQTQLANVLREVARGQRRRGHERSGPNYCPIPSWRFCVSGRPYLPTISSKSLWPPFTKCLRPFIVPSRRCDNIPLATRDDSSR